MSQNLSNDNQNVIIKIAKDAGLSGIGMIFSNFLSFINGILITRVVGATIYGIYLLANTAISIGSTLSLFGLSDGVLRYVSFYNAKNDQSRIKGTIISGLIIVLVLSFVISLSIFYFADILSIYIFHNLKVCLAIKFLIFSLPFLVCIHIFTKAIQGFKNIKDLILIQNFFKPIFRLISLILLFLLGLRLLGLLLSSIITSIILAFCAFKFLIITFPFMNSNINAVYQPKKLLNFSWPLLLTSFLDFIIHWTDIIMIGYFLTPKEAGIYGIVLKFSIFINIPLRSFNITFAPLISELYGKDNIEELKEINKLINKWIFTLSFPIFIIIIFFSTPLLHIFGDEFIAGKIPLIFFYIGQLINVLTGPVGYIIIMTGRPKVSLINSTLLAIQNIIFNYLLIPKYGITGAAIATCLSISIMNIIRLGEVYYFLKIFPYNFKFLKPIFGGILPILLFYLLRGKFLFKVNQSNVNIIILTFFFLILYLFLLYLFKFDKEDRFIIKKFSKKLHHLFF
ncbi:MAG: flippase [Candidatus Hodarchaeota archaeon]